MPENQGEKGPKPSPVDINPDLDKIPEASKHIKRLGIYATVGTVVALGAMVWAASSIDVRGGPDQPAETDATEQTSTANLSGVSFEESLVQTQEIPRNEPLVIANYDLSRVLDDNYDDGNNSVERVTVSAASCVLPSGAPAKAVPISRIIFRNSSDGTRNYKKGYLGEQHIANTEEYRTVFRQQYERNSKTLIEPQPFAYNSETDIFDQTQAEVCGVENAEMIDPKITSHRLLVDQHAYSGQPTYEAIDNGGYNFKDILAAVGLIAIAVGILAGLKKVKIIK